MQMTRLPPGNIELDDTDHADQESICPERSIDHGVGIYIELDHTNHADQESICPCLLYTSPSPRD